MKRIISIILMTAVLISTAAFADTEKKPDTAVESLKSQGILKGDESGNLNLESAVTRAEFCKLVSAAIKPEKYLAINPSSDFSDVKKSHWAYEYVKTASEYGIINGFGDGTFKPEDSVTYEQAIKIALVAAKIAYGFEAYPIGYVGAAVDNCLLDGMNASMGEAITREDAVNLIYNVQQYAAERKAEQDREHEFFLAAMSAPLVGGEATADSAESSKSIGGGGGSLATVHAPTSGDMKVEADSVSGGIIAQGAMSINSQPYFNTEEYTSNAENIFHNAALSPLSTFSIDTDTASYSNMRRFIIDGSVPTTGSIRSEELINYFDYDLPEPTDGTPFSVTTEVAKCPWDSDNQLAMIAVKGEEMTERAPQNLTLLIDVSGSMHSPNKLPLVKKSMKMLLGELDERDTISIVTYANGVELVLDSVNASEKDKIMDALNGLVAVGGTNGSGGLELAYEQAEKNKIDGNNRIILCTDGDFNIGPSSTAELEAMVTEKRDKGIFISVLGFGMGNYKDNRMEVLADKGNGSYYYIDNLREAKKVFVDEMTSTLYTIAKDVKIQVEFNPAKVSEYRLVGYENRKLNTEDFADDTKDAGELGAGTTVVALYEIVPAKAENTASGNDELRYQTSQYKESDELLCVNLRYKEPDGNESKLITQPVQAVTVDDTSENFRFASAVAEMGMILNKSEYKGTADYASVVQLAKSARGEDKYGIRTEFVQLVDMLKYIDR